MHCVASLNTGNDSLTAGHASVSQSCFAFFIHSSCHPVIVHLFSTLCLMNDVDVRTHFNSGWCSCAVKKLTVRLLRAKSMLQQHKPMMAVCFTSVACIVFICSAFLIIYTFATSLFMTLYIPPFVSFIAVLDDWLSYFIHLCRI